MNLQTIKNLMSETRQKLAALTAGSGDIDETVRRRMFEREKLSLLAEEQAAETARIEAARIAERDKLRTVLAKRFRKNAERDLAEDNRLTVEAMMALRTLVDALTARHKLWDPAAIGLLTPEAQASFTQDEHRELATALCNSHRPVRIAEFEAAVKDALQGVSLDAKDAIGRLFASAPVGATHAEAPTARDSVLLIDCARALHGKPYPTPVADDTPEAVISEPVTGARFEVDLRPPENRRSGPTTSRELEALHDVPQAAAVRRVVDGDVTRATPRRQVVG